MTLKTINGYRNTEESNQFSAAIQSRVTTGVGFMRDNTPPQKPTAPKGNTL